MKQDKTLINFIIDGPLLIRIEDFRFRNRFPTRAAAIKYLLDWALKQKPSLKNALLEQDESPEIGVSFTHEVETPAAPVAIAETIPAAIKPERVSLPSRESMVQALRDQGYEVGDAVRHSDGRERILVRSHDGSAWVSEGTELQDLAAGRTSLGELSARRAAGG